MSSKKDKHTGTATWAKHLRKFWKKEYWKRSRKNDKKAIKDG